MNNLIKSVLFDAQTFTIPRLHVGLFLVSKYASLARVVMSGHTGKLSAPWVTSGKVRLQCRSISDVGTAHACLIDLANDLRAIQMHAPNLAIKNIVDVGANIGQFWFAARTLCPDARITSIEPNPASFASLHASAHSDPAANLIMKGVGASVGTMLFNIHPQLSSMSSFAALADGIQAESQIEVATMTLDDLPAERINLLKIDVEGWEMNVLNGAIQTLQRTDYILIEISLKRHADASNLDVLKLIVEACPKAEIISIGRSLAGAAQDFLICTGS